MRPGAGLDYFLGYLEFLMRDVIRFPYLRVLEALLLYFLTFLAVPEKVDIWKNPPLAVRTRRGGAQHRRGFSLKTNKRTPPRHPYRPPSLSAG